MTRDAATEYAGTCTAPAARSDRMRDVVLEHAPRGRATRVLDLGCGTGSLVFRLATLMPSAELIGIDVSPANIAVAERRGQSEFQDRVRFFVADYLTFAHSPFDVIVSDGVLHLIAASTDALVGKLAADLTPGGLLVCDMPYDCSYNRMFATVRRTLRAIRSPVTDGLILAAARLLHARQMDEQQLRERVQYMYVPPERMMNGALAATFDAAGLRHTATHDNPSTSPSQLRHNITVWTKTAA